MKSVTIDTDGSQSTFDIEVTDSGFNVVESETGTSIPVTHNEADDTLTYTVVSEGTPLTCVLVRYDV